MANAGDSGGEASVSAGTQMPVARSFWLGLYLILSFLAQIALLIGFWPNVDATTQKWKSACPAPFTCELSDDARMIVIVLLSGGIGAMVHALRSFSAHMGTRHLTVGWGWWYLLRPLEGAVISLAFYLVLRGGLIGSNGANQTSSTVISIYGMAGIAVLVGMFSQEAVAKLKEVAETLFSKATSTTSAAAAQPAPKPVLTKIAPTTAAVGDKALEVAVTGSGFTEKSKVQVNGTDAPTKFVSATELRLTLTAVDLQVAKTLQIGVQTPAPGGGTAATPLPFEIA
jgi:hypothetical protein